MNIKDIRIVPAYFPELLCAESIFGGIEFPTILGVGRFFALNKISDVSEIEGALNKLLVRRSLNEKCRIITVNNWSAIDRAMETCLFADGDFVQADGRFACINLLEGVGVIVSAGGQGFWGQDATNKRYVCSILKQVDASPDRKFWVDQVLHLVSKRGL